MALNMRYWVWWASGRGNGMSAKVAVFFGVYPSQVVCVGCEPCFVLLVVVSFYTKYV